VNNGYKFRDWVFTLNNPSPKQMEDVLNSDQIRYIAYQLEMSNTETRHLQGYVEFNEPMSFVEALELFSGGNFHLERRRGTREQARDYCMKEKSRIRGPWVQGEWFEEDDTDERCQGLTKKGEQCKNLALPDKKFCGTHKPN